MRCWFCLCGYYKRRRRKRTVLFLIDYNNTPGVTRIPIHSKVGMWTAPTSELVFENAVIPKEIYWDLLTKVLRSVCGC